MYRILGLIALLLVGCNRQNENFLELEDSFTMPGIEVIGNGLYDTAFVRIPARPEITRFANKPRDTIFWSPLDGGDITQYAKSGYCIINAKMDYIGNCPYRIYCGTGEMLRAMMSSGINYAVEICK